MITSIKTISHTHFFIYTGLEKNNVLRRGQDNVPSAASVTSAPSDAAPEAARAALSAEPGPVWS